MTQRTYANEDDKRLTPALAAEVGGLRGSMLDAAERHPLPPGFEARPTGHPTMALHHLPSGRSYHVGLHSYGVVREVLSLLYPDGLEATDGGGTRFAIDMDAPTLLVTDKATGRKAMVPLHAVRSVKNVLWVIADGHVTAEMRAFAQLFPEIEVAGGKLERALYPGGGQPAYRVLDAADEQIAWLRHEVNEQWVLIDRERFEQPDERVKFQVFQSVEGALPAIEDALASLASRPAPK